MCCTPIEELLEEMADDLTTPPPSCEKVDLESVTAPPLYPVLPSAELPLPLGVWMCGMCVWGGGGGVYVFLKTTFCFLIIM